MSSEARNPITWVEIYVNDMSRAQKFYESMLNVQMTAMQMPEGSHEMQMVCFPWADGQPNISGALVRMEGVSPGNSGTIVYFACEDCSVEESRVESAGGKVCQTKMSIGDYGFCSIVMDTEGNTIGLHSMK